jgi:hypothetical protein
LTGLNQQSSSSKKIPQFFEHSERIAETGYARYDDWHRGSAPPAMRYAKHLIRPTAGKLFRQAQKLRGDRMAGENPRQGGPAVRV